MADALRREVTDRLDEVDATTRQDDPETLLPLARAELPRLAESWRQLLSAHQPDDDGRCQGCPPGIRRRRWPCQVWFTAHDHLIGDTLPVGTSRPVPVARPRVTRAADIPAPSAAPDDRAGTNRAPRDGTHRTPADGAAADARRQEATPSVRLPVIHRVEVTGEQPAAASPPSLNELTIPRAFPALTHHLETDSAHIHRAAVGGRPTTLPWQSPPQD